jgi:ribosome-associated protein
LKNTEIINEKPDVDYKNNQKFIIDLLKYVDELKLTDVIKIDLDGKSKEADHMVIASGSSARLVISSAQKLIQYLKASHNIISKAEGLSGGDWILIDSGDLIIHLFRPEVREYYQLEKMWQDPQLQ